ncbi:EnvZ/OmpR regulon moderator MzrA [Scandinavium sp. H11S7]|uniref:Modulator protein MzrA n=1 Tax=Scandinavium hiltneri TaxID=2926519 RepID=A0ABT2E008_9ENTR|nr:EnvZ/OmpR regulon moderator MzrA [Scandinavium hiltneri]MCS2161087.1 EnvZ/OmpR regulon moderator MzrA [Scandinavium hiltneri]
MGLRNVTLRRFSISLGALLMLCTLLWFWAAIQQRESTLAIRPVSANISMPDGFSIWHHLDANGIRFKSITPQNDALVIKFESSDQSAAAKEVLDRTLPHGYIIAQLDDEDSLAPQWLSRLRDTPHRFG